jgi:hypothetical protein
MERVTQSEAIVDQTRSTVVGMDKELRQMEQSWQVQSVLRKVKLL